MLRIMQSFVVVGEDVKKVVEVTEKERGYKTSLQAVYGAENVLKCEDITSKAIPSYDDLVNIVINTLKENKNISNIQVEYVRNVLNYNEK